MKTLLILFLASYLATWIWGVYSFFKNKGNAVKFKNIKSHFYLSLVT